MVQVGHNREKEQGWVFVDPVLALSARQSGLATLAMHSTDGYPTGQPTTDIYRELASGVYDHRRLWVALPGMPYVYGGASEHVIVYHRSDRDAVCDFVEGHRTRLEEEAQALADRVVKGAAAYYRTSGPFSTYEVVMRDRGAYVGYVTDVERRAVHEALRRAGFRERTVVVGVLDDALQVWWMK